MENKFRFVSDSDQLLFHPSIHFVFMHRYVQVNFEFYLNIVNVFGSDIKLKGKLHLSSELMHFLSISSIFKVSHFGVLNFCFILFISFCYNFLLNPNERV
jgi:hypothetical protein